MKQNNTFRDFLKEEGEAAPAGGTTSGDIATVDSKLDLVKRPKKCKQHNLLNCSECEKEDRK